MVNRAKVLAYATDYWWRPCKDGIVWVQSVPIDVAQEAKDRKKPDWVGVFLWYPANGDKRTNRSYDGFWETLALVPKDAAEKIKKQQNDNLRTWADYATVGSPWRRSRTTPSPRSRTSPPFPAGRRRLLA